MAKRKTDAPPTPTDKIRFVSVMTREQRARFRYFCDRLGLDMEKVGTQWIMERLAAEESALSRKSK